MPTTAIAPQSFQYIQEWDDCFLSLFPHRFDYIWAERPKPGEKPLWKTEKRHPLSDRLIHQGKYLYGVRFGQVTHYLLIDIDADSAYHPQQDRQAIAHLTAALENLGLVAYLACTSSYSGGIHLYFPFEQTQNCYQLADAVAVVLEKAGFILAPGQLETFPNVKPYVEGQPSLFNAHRLPLQEPGAYLLNQDWQPIYTSQSEFVRSWNFAQVRNTLDSDTITRLLKSQKRKRYRLSTRASKFLSDLDAEIEAGWSGHGQTNHLLGRIALREYIFHHLIHGGAPLAGDALAAAIATVARTLPGYTEWCRHQHELEQKALEWARSVEGSRYYPYGYGIHQSQPTLEPGWNERQRLSARERIKCAIADLLNQEKLPSGITARRSAIVSYGISQSTLSKHKDLWHPDFLSDRQVIPDPNELHPNSAQIQDNNFLESLQEGQLHPTTTNKLYELESSEASQRHSDDQSVNAAGGSGGFSTGTSEMEKLPGVAEAISKTKALLEAMKIAKIKERSNAFTDRLQKYLQSGDPILINEANQCLRSRNNCEYLDPAGVSTPDKSFLEHLDQRSINTQQPSSYFASTDMGETSDTAKSGSSSTGDELDGS